MPLRARYEITRPGEIAVYHTWSRCVQRAFLFGKDPETGFDHSDRRGELEKLIKYQAGVFAVDIGNYSILSNHFHLLARTRPDVVENWSDEEVAFRWRAAWPSWSQGEWVRRVDDHQVQQVLDDPKRLAYARAALGDLSWLMARIKEPIAKRVNRLNHKSGHVWEARFGSRMIETELDLFQCSIYVDLNQLKAGMIDSLEESRHAGLEYRLQQEARQQVLRAEAEKSIEEFRRDAASYHRYLEAEAEELFAGSHLSPITTFGPLMTTEQLNVSRAQWECGAEKKDAAAVAEPAVAEAAASSSESAEPVPELESSPNAKPSANAEASSKSIRSQPLSLDEELDRIEFEDAGKRLRSSGLALKGSFTRMNRLFPNGIPSRNSDVTFLSVPLEDYLKGVRLEAQHFLEVERPKRWQQLDHAPVENESDAARRFELSREDALYRRAWSKAPLVSGKTLLQILSYLKPPPS
jgi:REP element-mobilizing transposase RayT